MRCYCWSFECATVRAGNWEHKGSTVLMGITAEVTWFWARSCDSGFLILEKAVALLPAAVVPASQNHRLPASFLTTEEAAASSAAQIYCDAWAGNPAQSRSHALTLPIHPCNQSLLLDLVGGCWVLNQDSNQLTNRESLQSFPLPWTVLAPRVFFCFPSLHSLETF